MNAENPKKEITETVYYKINRQIQRLVQMSKREFHCERIFLLGGIIINTSEDFADYVDIRNFEVVNVQDLEEIQPVSILETEAFKNL